MKIFQKFAYLLVGLMLGLTMAFAQVAVAATGTKSMEVTYKNIKVNINGKATTLTDLEGNAQEPVIMSDTVYVPLSAIARAFGKTSSFDSANNTVNISDSQNSVSSTPSAQGKIVRLSDLDYLAKKGRDWKLTETQANTGDYLQDSFLIDSGGYGLEPNTRDYLLNAEYTKISGKVFLTYKSRDTVATYRFQIWGDGALLFSSDEIKSGFLPQSFDVNISGVKILKIGFSHEYGSSSPNLGIAGVTLQ